MLVDRVLLQSDLGTWISSIMWPCHLQHLSSEVAMKGWRHYVNCLGRSLWARPESSSCHFCSHSIWLLVTVKEPRRNILPTCLGGGGNRFDEHIVVSATHPLIFPPLFFPNVYNIAHKPFCRIFFFLFMSALRFYFIF